MNESTGVMGLGGGVWLIAIIVLMMMFGNNGFGGWGGNNFANAIGFENLATQSQVDRGFDAQNSMANQRDILSAVTNGTAQSVAATNQAFHDSLAVTQNLYNELQRDVAANAVTLANLQGNQAQCCCEVKQAIAQSNYDGAMRDAATNANFTAQIQSVKDAIAQNKVEALQAQVNQLQLAQATSGMLRFPNSWTYGAGPFPPIFGCAGATV